jgi:hypothetical protein
MAKRKVIATEKEKVERTQKENSNLVKKIASKLPSLKHIQKAYELITQIPEKYYQYKINSVKDVLESVKGVGDSPMKFKLLEQTLYGLLDYRKNVSFAHRKEYDELCEKVAKEANLIQPKISPERRIKYLRQDGEIK